MAWRRQENIVSGQFVLGTLTEGNRFDPFGTLSADEILERMRQFADGWTPTNVVWNEGFFGIGDKMQIFGQAQRNIPSEVVSAQMAKALDSFWSVGYTEFSVAASDSLSAAIPNNESGSWTTTFQLAAIAIIAVAIVWGIKELREIAE